jgi:hypothetical protein
MTSFEPEPLERLGRIAAEIRALQAEALGPAVDSSLQLSLHYLHLAHQFLGGTELSPEIDGEL